MATGFITKSLAKKVVILTKKTDPVFEQIKSNLGKNKDAYRPIEPDKPTWSELTYDAQQHVLEEEVSFQGHPISFDRLVGKFADGLIDSETLTQLLNDETVTIGQQLPISNGYDKDYYIDRTFNHQVSIKKNFSVIKHSLT